MSRIAWFTPLPPVTSGVSQYNVELIPGLATVFDIEVFVDDARSLACAGLGAQVFSAHDFVWKHARRPYDLIVYQLGNAPCHDYMWAYMVRYPGLVVLHDGQLHHARTRHLLAQRRENDYRREFEFNHPGTNPAFAELGIVGLLGPLMYFWPMRRVVVETARALIVHNTWLAEEIREESPRTTIHTVEMGVPPPAVHDDARARIRARHAIPADAVVFVALGGVTQEKRIPQAIRALASIRRAVPEARLLLVGNNAWHYDALADARAMDVEDRVILADYVPESDVPLYLASADVCLCLRWPTSRETSSSWLRCLAAGRATIITDLSHLVDIPSFDPRSWRLQYAPEASTEDPEPRPPVEPACISIDILDEDHSLRLAMRRLATDARLRATLGERAKALWRARFSLERMVSRYRDVIRTATDSASRVERPDGLPQHFSTDGAEHANRLLKEMGLSASQIAELWQEHS